MSTSTSTTETIQTNVRGAAILSDSLSADGPWRVHGVAIGPDETTVGMSGQKKFWPGEALQAAAETLSGKNIVKNHVNNDVDAVVGAVTEARYHPEYGVIYEGEIDEEGLAKKVARNRLDVSPRIVHNHVDELEENDEGALVVDDVKEFINLALVPQGAASSNEIEIGHSGVLSMSQAELRQAFDVECEGDAEVTEADADDLDADEDLGFDGEIEVPVSGEESAPVSSEGDERGADSLAADSEDDADPDATEDEQNPMSEDDAAGTDDHDDDVAADKDETEDEELACDGECGCRVGDGVLSELTFLGADSEETAREIDLRDLDILQ